MAEETPSSIDILDLNDDCLRRVLNDLSLTELATVADVCSRLKSVAQAHFASAVYSKELCINVEYLMPNRHTDTRLLRNFGAFYKSITLKNYCEVRDIAKKGKPHLNIIRILSLMRAHCRPIQLELDNFIISARVIQLLRPVFQNLEALIISKGEAISMLSENFPKLKSFAIKNSKLNGNDFQIFSQRNSQLKSISIDRCNEVNFAIFRSISMYVSQIEKLQFNVSSQMGESFDENRKHLAELSKLRHFELGAVHGSLVSAITEISRAKVPIEYLAMYIQESDPSKARRYIEAFIGLSKLKKVILYENKCLSALHITHSHSRLICGQHHHPQMTSDSFLQLLVKHWPFVLNEK